MSLYVLKFGGSSVSTTSRIENVADIIRGLYLAGHKLVVVVSAMQGTTNQLIDLAKSFSKTGYSREYDVVISSGEQISSGLLALCLQKNGIVAKSFQGWQLPIITNSCFGEASIRSIDVNKLLNDINSGIIPVISGFQGVSKNNDITTIGRGGSDASAVVLSRFLDADECFIYTDVNGVYTADPRIVLESKKLSHLSYEDMCELSANGAKVLQNRSVKIAKEQNIKIRVVSSFSSDGAGTVIQQNTNYLSKIGKLAGIAHNTSVFSIVPNENIVFLLKEKNIEFIDFGRECIIVNKSHQEEIRENQGRTQGNPKQNQNDQNNNQNQGRTQRNYQAQNSQNNFVVDNDIGVISVVGQNLLDFENFLVNTLHNNNIHLKNKKSSNKSITLVVPLQQTEKAVNILHDVLF